MKKQKHKHKWKITETYGYKSYQCGCGAYKPYEKAQEKKVATYKERVK